MKGLLVTVLSIMAVLPVCNYASRLIKNVARKKLLRIYDVIRAAIILTVVAVACSKHPMIHTKRVALI